MIDGALPYSVASRDDVFALLPKEYRDSLDAPVRDALVDALFALLRAAEDAGDFAAAQSDPNRAVGVAENGLFEDRGVPRARGEEDESYRDRALAVPRLVTFTAIRDAVNLILAPFTSATCRISEGILDRWFLSSGGDVWQNFFNRTPNYPDRVYDFPVGTGVPGNDTSGLLLCSGTVGRHFILRVPELRPSSGSTITPYDGAPTVETGFFVGLGDAPAFIGASFNELFVYEAIAITVRTLVGHSVRWTMLSDSRLN